MKKSFAFMAILCLTAVFSSLAPAASGPVQCQYFPGTTFTIDGDISEWPAGSLILSGITVADQGIPATAWPDPNPLYSVDIYTAWDADYFYIAYDVTDPDAGLKTDDHPSFVGNRFVKDMLRIYFEMDNDGVNETGPNSGEVTWDIMASQTDNYNVSHMVVNPAALNFSTDSANYANSANGTLIANASADGAATYVVEARLSWLDLSARLALASMPFTMPADGTVWGYDFLFIDDTPIQAHVDNDAGYEGGGQFVLHELHVPSTWSKMTFTGDPAQGEPPATAGVPLIHDGLYAAKLTRTTDGGDSGFDTNDAKIDVTGITTVNISWWMRSGTEGDSTITAIGVAPFDSAQAYLGGSYGEPNLVAGDNVVGTDWEFRSYDYTVPGADVNFINLGIRMPAGNSIVIDDLKIVDTANAGVNLAPNGSFEDWGNGGLVGAATDAVADDGVADSWRFFAVAGAQGILERVGSSVVTNAQEGRYAAKLTRITGGGDSGFDIDNAKIDVTGLTAVKVSWWMRSGSGADTPMNSFVVAPFNSAGAFVGGTYGQPNLVQGDNIVGATWQYRSYEYVIPDPEVTQIMLGIRMDPGNSVVLDDIVVEDTANPGVNMKTNGGFEAWGGGAIVGAATDAIANDGVPDAWRFFAVGGAQGQLERLEFQPPAPNAVQLDWTAMK